MNPTPTSQPARRRAAQGFTLIELMVAMAIGLALTLALTTVMIFTPGPTRCRSQARFSRRACRSISAQHRNVMPSLQGFARAFQAWISANGR